MPASTILLLESDRGAGDTISSILTGAGYGVTLTADPDVALAKAPTTSWSSSTSSSGPTPAVDVCREFRATPAAVGDPGHVRRARPTRSRSGSPSSKPAPTTSWPGRSTPASSRPGSRPCSCASSARATSTAGHLRRRGDDDPGAADGRGLQPEGRRRDDDHRHNIAVAAAAQRPDRVVLIDLALQFGNVATHLNLDAAADHRRRRSRRRRDARA